MNNAPYQLLPPLTDEEFGELKADIARRGVLVPVEVDEQGTILDGHHRVRACQELGIAEYPTIARAGLSEAAKRAHVRALNLLRRHLNREQRRALIADALREAPERSNRQHAAELGVSHHTVEGVRDELESIGQIAQCPTVTTADGRQYPTARVVRAPDPELDLDVRPVSAFGSSAREAVKAAGDAVAVADALPAVATADEVRRVVRTQRREGQRAETAALAAETAAPAGRYRTIVIDPPWAAADTGDCDPVGKGDPSYHVMPLDEIRALPVADLAEPNDCHLYLWVTNRTLRLGFDLLDAWEFRYLTTLTWCKPSIGVGRYYRNNTEHVLFAMRGERLLARTDVGTWFAADRQGPHSTKPQEFYDLVESCSPGPRIDLFARRARDGWVVWGAEA